MVDVNAIREDVEMAARSPEMARHVALDHVPELLDIIERVRMLAEDTGEFQARAKHVHCGSARLLGMEIRRALDGEAGCG